MNDDGVFVTELQRHFDTEPLYKSLKFYNKDSQYNPLSIAFNDMTVIIVYRLKLCYMMFYTGELKSISKEIGELNDILKKYTYSSNHIKYMCSGVIEFNDFKDRKGITEVIDYIVKFNISQIRKYNEDMKMKIIKKIS